MKKYMGNLLQMKFGKMNGIDLKFLFKETKKNVMIN